jgi:hypothetical protein
MESPHRLMFNIGIGVKHMNRIKDVTDELVRDLEDVFHDKHCSTHSYWDVEFTQAFILSELLTDSIISRSIKQQFIPSCINKYRRDEWDCVAIFGTVIIPELPPPDRPTVSSKEVIQKLKELQRYRMYVGNAEEPDYFIDELEHDYGDSVKWEDIEKIINEA